MTTDQASTHRGDRFDVADRIQLIHPPGDVLATVPDRAETYLVRWAPGSGWACSCRARTAACGHIAAVRRIVILDPDQDDDVHSHDGTGDPNA